MAKPDEHRIERLASEVGSSAQDSQGLSVQLRAAFEDGYKHGYRQGWEDGVEHGRWEDGDALRQVESAHSALDMMGVSRKSPGGETLTVRGRLDTLRGLR